MHVISPFSISKTQMHFISPAGSQTVIQAHVLKFSVRGFAGWCASWHKPGTVLLLWCMFISHICLRAPYIVNILFSIAAASLQKHHRLHLFRRLTDCSVRLLMSVEVSKIPHQPCHRQVCENMTYPSVHCTWGNATINLGHRGGFIAYRSQRGGRTESCRAYGMLTSFYSSVLCFFVLVSSGSFT
jgi:hypothetical protein